MTEAWFSPEAARSLAFLSLFAVLAALDPLARRGRARILVTGLYGASIAVGAALMIAGIIAALTGQPAHVWRPLAFAGFVVTLPLTFGFREMQRIYREAELRRTVASDL
jgi:hypothetical protein